MTVPADTEQGCVWTRTSVSDDGVGHWLDRLRAQDPGDEDWQAHCDLLADTYEDVLREQTPCMAVHYRSGTITACVRHIDRIDPRAAAVTALLRMAEGTPEVQR